jgi:anti-sigma regulatory factor (Ser/Thr protein kinase)
MSVGTLAVTYEPTSAARVRHSIADDLASEHVAAECIDDVVLVASELVGNAVLHGAAAAGHALDVSWEIEAQAVVVRVLDGSPELPRHRSTNENETGGRGLDIVAALASDWGVRRNDGGKQVWARVPIARG